METVVIIFHSDRQLNALSDRYCMCIRFSIPMVTCTGPCIIPCSLITLLYKKCIIINDVKWRQNTNKFNPLLSGVAGWHCPCTLYTTGLESGHVRIQRLKHTTGLHQTNSTRPGLLFTVCVWPSHSTHLTGSISFHVLTKWTSIKTGLASSQTASPVTMFSDQCRGRGSKERRPFEPV